MNIFFFRHEFWSQISSLKIAKMAIYLIFCYAHKKMNEILDGNWIWIYILKSMMKWIKTMICIAQDKKKF